MQIKAELLLIGEQQCLTELSVPPSHPMAALETPSEPSWQALGSLSPSLRPCHSAIGGIWVVLLMGGWSLHFCH